MTRKRNPNSIKRCSIEGCNSAHESKGFCAMHYQRFKRYGDPLETKTPTLGLSLPEKIKLKSSIDDSTGCINWTGTITTAGYGHIWNNGTNLLAHREAWKLVNGSIPDGMCICHRCDNPRCVNPAHLFLGTQQDNMDDKMNKGRHVVLSGENNPVAKLTENKVKAILVDGRACADIGKDYGVAETTIRHIKKGETWRSVSCV